MVHILSVGRTSDAKSRLLAVALDLMWSQSCHAISVDQICRKAAVNKGSFYYFFPSKSDLVVAACEAYWQQSRPAYDKIFAPTVPPLERLQNFCCAIYDRQKAKWEQTGRVWGCPIASVGSELSTQDEKIRQKSAEIIAQMCRYFEGALRDAHRAGLIENDDFQSKAQSLYACVLGMLLQAKIRQDVEELRQLWPIAQQMIKPNKPITSATPEPVRNPLEKSGYAKKINYPNSSAHLAPTYLSAPLPVPAPAPADSRRRHGRLDRPVRAGGCH